MIPPALFSFLKIVLATQNLLRFHTNFRNICSTSAKKKNAIFIMNGCWILSNTFQNVSKSLCDFFFFFCSLHFVNSRYHVDFFGMLNHPCIPGINPTWLWCMILLCIVDSVCSYFVEDFYIYVHQEYRPVI